MSVAFTGNFLSNAYGIKFKDSVSVAWTFNKNTNELTATAGGAAASPDSTGWGTSTGGLVENNFAGGSASLAVTSAAVAKIIAALKTFGILGS